MKEQKIVLVDLTGASYLLRGDPDEKPTNHPDYLKALPLLIEDGFRVASVNGTGGAKHCWLVVLSKP